MIYILLIWLFPFLFVLLFTYLIDDRNMTVRDFLELAGVSLIPAVNWCVLYIVVVEIVKNNEKFQEFLDKKLK